MKIPVFTDFKLELAYAFSSCYFDIGHMPFRILY